MIQHIIFTFQPILSPSPKKDLPPIELRLSFLAWYPKLEEKLDRDPEKNRYQANCFMI